MGFWRYVITWGAQKNKMWKIQSQANIVTFLRQTLGTKWLNLANLGLLMNHFLLSGMNIDINKVIYVEKIQILTQKIMKLKG